MKRNVAVIFGGTNTEHEVSIVSARSVIDHLDPKKYNVIPVYISKSNQWHQLAPKETVSLPATTNKEIVPTDLPEKKIDVVFPVLHGPYGEDGTIQGMLKLLHLPFVGTDVLASAICMDKVVQKQLALQQGLPTVKFTFTTAYQWKHNPDQILNEIANFQFPLFIKPANQGSSVGVVKVDILRDVPAAINTALQYDSKVLIEQGVTNAREIECSVLGNDEPQASILGEIIPSNEFYDYDAKYIDGKSVADIPAKLPPKTTKAIQDIAIKAFQVMNCSGLARVDFLVNGKTNEIFLNELNTMPGFTHISMYPKLWEASGLSYEQLLERLIELALEKFDDDSKRVLSFTPKLAWHKDT